MDPMGLKFDELSGYFIIQRLFHHSGMEHVHDISWTAMSMGPLLFEQETEVNSDLFEDKCPSYVQRSSCFALIWHMPLWLEELPSDSIAWVERINKKCQTNNNQRIWTISSPQYTPILRFALLLLM